MKTYSKGKMKLKRAMFVIALILLIMLVIGVILLTCFCLKNKINIVKEDTSATGISDDVALNSQPVIVDNLVVGALYNDRWVSASKYYTKSNKKSDVEISVYTKNKSAGIYKVENVYSIENSIFANTSYVNFIDEYFATPNKETDALISNFSEIAISDIDYVYAKEALGYLRIYNGNINISKVYSGNIDSNTPVKILAISSGLKGKFGGIYNAIVVAYPDKNKAEIVEYSYTKDLENSDDYPLYSVEFLADINGDGKSDLISRSVTEFNVSYDIFEYKNGAFVRVLSETMEVK